MFLSQRRLILGATLAASLFFTAGLAIGAPPPGSRWSDHARGSSSGGGSATPFRSYGAVPIGPATPAATSPSSSGETIAIRGPDGVVRYYPVAPGATVRRPGTLGSAPYVTVRGPDGVLRTYPVPTPSKSGPATGTTTPPPVRYYYYVPCP